MPAPSSSHRASPKTFQPSGMLTPKRPSAWSKGPMTSYSKEVIADLVAGTLPWPQTRRIMSAYKDDDRFFKYVAVLQDRVGWKAPILLPVSDHLFICESGGERVTRCECGHS